MVEPIDFRVQGVPQGGARGDGLWGADGTRASPLAGRGQVKASVQLAAQRGGGAPVAVSAVPGEDIVVLHLSHGPSLVLHPAHARDLLLAQQGLARGADGAPGEVEVGASLRWLGLEAAAPARGAGFLGDVLLAGFEVLTGFKADAADFVASAVVRQVDGRVTAGVYALSPDALAPLKDHGQRLARVPDAPPGAPLLVLLHGTFVDTASTFAKLWTTHPGSVRELFAAYGGRVYALDHPTLGASPLANAITLAEALPVGTRLHLASHSRGGLVAEVLARLCTQRELSPADLAFFAGDEHAAWRDELQRLAALVRERDLHVDRVVRVACPARGTALASQRLDAYLSVLRWSLDLVGLPVAGELLDFLAEVARRRADPRALPGLSAMLPDSPLLQWLNAPPAPIAGQLRVIAGDLQGDTLGSWVKTLLADAFYWTDNDLVVQTRSMYGGAPRAGGAQFLLDQGSQVTHFAYFSNARSVQALVDALTQDQPAGFRTIGPLSWAGRDSGGQRAGADARPQPDKPAVFVLPGILGSHLAAGGRRVWLSAHLIGHLQALRYTPGQADDVQPDGPIQAVYGALIDHLAASHEVIPFAYDWRRPIEDEARRLADAIDRALVLRQSSGQPVRLLAHSMGGLVARTVQLERPGTWQAMMARAEARVVMLGTPNGGSWSPMQVLSGDDTFGNALAAFGSPLQDHEARQIMAAMPGFLQLQAGLLDQGLDDPTKWQQLADDDLQRVQQRNWWHRTWLQDEGPDHQLTAYRWGVPPAAVLAMARALRQRLDAQVRHDLPAFADKMLLVVGHDGFTPDGIEMGAEGLVYLDATDGGDGRVPLASALLPGVRTWSRPVAHGALPDDSGAFDAYVDLLVRGTTERLPPLPATRGAAATPHVRSRPARSGRRPDPPESERDVFVPPRAPQAVAPAGASLRVEVLNADLAFVRQPLMLGHYRAHVLTGTEAALDRVIGGTLSASLAAGLYPADTGSVQVFVNRRLDPQNPWRAPCPPAAIVIGLGDEGALRERDLVLAVRQGVVASAQRVAEQPGGAPACFDLTTTLMGSGGLSVQAGNAARAIAQGVRDANERLAASGWPVVGTLTLVERYPERAADAWHGLQVLATALPGRYEVAAAVGAGIGALRRQVDTGYRGTDYDFISATTAGEGSIAFTLDSRRARSELRAQVTQARLVRELVQRASTAAHQDPQIGRTLFQLLVPPELEPFLGGTSQMLIELDDGTAPIPWELLDTPDDRRGGGDARPWAIRSRLLRKLRTPDFRERVQDATLDDHVLVVGEPLVDDPRYGRLPGALAEARAVAALLAAEGGIGPDRLQALVDRNDASTVVSALLARRYRVVHIAGHGEAGGQGGVVMSGGTFLGPREIRQMRTVPELVFVNCCHLAAREPGHALRDFDRSQFAAGVADALIRIGVRCVVAAGWAVDDAPAALFATTFYRQLLDGAPFITAVGAAREAAWQQGGTTWAAYQCYGDPNWTYRCGELSQPAQRPFQAYESISSPLALTLVLEELAVGSRWQGLEPARQRERVRWLEGRFGAAWGEMGAVAEAFGLAYAESGDRPAAIGWYERAVAAGDASASMKAGEQLANLRARHAWTLVAQASPTSADFAAGRRQIRAALEMLEALARLQPTLERASTAGSAWKRLFMLETRAGHAVAAAAALKQAAARYRDAEAMARAQGHDKRFYPALNRLACDLVASLGSGSAVPLDESAVAAVRRQLAARTRDDPDFWSMVGLAELEQLLALAERRLAPRLDEILAGYEDVHAHVASVALWSSLADQSAFVLLPYVAATRGAEQAAAQRLLQRLQQWGAVQAA